MIDAVIAFYTEKIAVCALYKRLVGFHVDGDSEQKHDQQTLRSNDLNDSQHAALNSASSHPLAFLWGPPSTGKTHTIVAILKELLMRFKKSRFLVTAPTHNAVDNILQHLIRDGTDGGIEPLRISTSVS